MYRNFAQLISYLARQVPHLTDRDHNYLARSSAGHRGVNTAWDTLVSEPILYVRALFQIARHPLNEGTVVDEQKKPAMRPEPCPVSTDNLQIMISCDRHQPSPCQTLGLHTNGFGVDH